MGYKTLLVRESEKLKLHLDNIIIETINGDIRFQISDLKLLIIENYKCVLSVQLINKLIDNNVAVVISNLSHMPNCQIMPLNGYYASSKMLMRQLQWKNETKSLVHKCIVQAKIQSQIDNLLNNNKSPQVIEKLIQFKNEVQIDDYTNREGLAAKVYFRELFGKDFKRFDEDIVNASLDFGYAVLRSLISSSAISKGLLLNIGIFHKGMSNNSNLSDDIIEVFRPIVDDYVYRNISFNEDKILSKDHRDGLIKTMDIKISFDNQKHTLNNSIGLYIDSVISCMDNDDIKFYKPPSLRKDDDLSFYEIDSIL